MLPAGRGAGESGTQLAAQAEKRHHDRQESLHCRLWQLVSSSVKECVGGQRGLPQVCRSQGRRLGEQEVLQLPLLSLAYPTGQRAP